MATPLQIQPFAQDFDLAGQRAEGEQFISEFGAAIPRIRGEVETQLGLPQLRETSLGLQENISDISGQIRGVPNIVDQTSMQSLVTQGQRGRLIAKQQQPLQENLAQFLEAEARISPRLAATEKLAGQQVGELLLPFQLGFSLLEQRQAREASLYSEKNQLELNRLIANLNAGVQLSVAEQNRLNQLAIAEAGFKNNLEGIRLRGEESRKTKKAPEDLGSLFRSIFG